MNSQGDMLHDTSTGGHLLGTKLKEAKRLVVHLELVSCFPLALTEGMKDSQ